MVNSYLQGLVIHKCKELVEPEKAAEFFGVGVGLIRQWIAGSKTPSLAAVEKVFVVPESPTNGAGWEGTDVFIALPFYKSTNPLTLWSLLGVWDRSKFRACMRYNDAFIVHARNSLASQFLATSAAKSWWVDDDMVSPMGNATWFNQFADFQLPEKYAGLHTPTQLRSREKSFVSALYVGRSSKGRAMYAEALAETPEGNLENQWAHGAPYDLIKPTGFVGFGCCLIDRQVFLDVQAKFPHLAPQRPDEPFCFFSNASDALLLAIPELKQKIDSAANEIRAGTHDAAIRLLEDSVKQIEGASSVTREESRLQQGEDRTFCRRAITAGHQPYVDFSVCCGHVGPKVFNNQNTSS